MHTLIWMEETARVATGALVTAMWQGAALAFVAWLGMRLLPKTPAGVRFAVWFGVFAVVVALPVVGLVHSTRTPADDRALVTVGIGWSLAIAGFWLTASALRAATLVVAAVRLRKLWKRATPVDSFQFSANTGRRAQVCVSDEVDRPSVIGFLSPKILLPEWLIAKLTADELEQIVLHEAGHLGRADDWLNLFQKIALVIFPLNPALIWIERKLCFERELACDERVLGETRAPKAYAACLATLAEYRMGRLTGALSLGALGRESELGQRIGRILARRETMSPARARLVLTGAMAVLVAGATELSRCPEVVAFSGTQPQMRVAEGSAVKQNGYMYQSVVFHPEARKAVRPEPSHGNATATKGAVRQVQLVSTARVHNSQTTPLLHRTPDRVAGDEIIQPSFEQRPIEWVVLTSWDGTETARMVLTAAPDPSEAQPRPAEQVHPYAAVPVRGGWLVFQL